MFVAVWRYSLALSVAAAGGVLAQPALAHGHHHYHVAYARAAHHDAHVYGRRHAAFMMAAAPQGWSGQGASYMPPPQNYWQHGWRGHTARQAAFQQNGWQQNSWQQNSWQQNSWQQTAWQQDNWQRQSARQRRLAQRQQAAFYSGAAPGYTSTYYDYAQQSSSWSSYGGGFGGQSALSGMIAQAASTAGVPLSLAERVVRRESGGNPRAVHAGNYGLMQIRLGTARAMGYGGSAAGLLDPSVNMTYAMRYLAGAYRAAGGSESRAVALYSRGYHATPARAQTYTF